MTRNTNSGFSLDRQTVRATVQGLLPEPIEIGNEENLISLGLDSLKIMRLANSWRRAGASVNFGSLMENPCLDHWWSLLQEDKGHESFLPEMKTSPAPGMPFDLTDVQYAYWIGRRDGQPLGGVGCHAYLELDGKEVDPQRLEQAWNMILRHHPMLRARFLEDGTQVITDTSACPQIHTVDLRNHDREKIQAELESIRNRLSHHRFAADAGETAGITLSLLPACRTRLHLHVDLLVADVHSLHILLRDLALAYSEGIPPSAAPDWSFADYLARRKTKTAKQREQDAAYWAKRLPDLPGAPALPLRRDPASLSGHRFTRRTAKLDAVCWERLKSHAASFGLTPAMSILALYAKVLERWSEEARFLIALPMFDRQLDEPGIEDVIADFTNLLVLEADCGKGEMFHEFARALQQQFNRDVAHSVYSGVEVQRDIARLRGGERLIAPVVFAYNADSPLADAKSRAAFGNITYMISQTPQVWLDLQLYTTESGMLFAWDAVEELFPDGVLDAMVAAFAEGLEWLTLGREHWAHLPEFKSARVTEARSPIALHSPCTLHDDFFRVAAELPHKDALINPETGESLSYGTLAREALQTAGMLSEVGVKSGDTIAVCLPRGQNQILAVLGILSLGAVYVPVSPSLPLARRERILGKAGIRFVLTSEALSGNVVWPGETHVISVENRARATALAKPASVEPDSTAYIIFTSGSTGEPKGVVIAHAAAKNTIAAINTLYDVTGNDRVLCVSSLDFDLSVYDIFGLLSCGGTLVLVSEDAKRDAAKWAAWVAEYKITLWNSVPLILEMLLESIDNENHSLKPLRLALISGDRIGLDLPDTLKKAAPGCRFIGMGGATEASIWSNHIEVTPPLPEHWASIPYGYPLPGQQYRVVDARGRDCPAWVPGELLIGGLGVAKGYAGDDELTKERFITNKNERWYRTGDRGRFWPDGVIEFLGRRDFQVKIRGHRIELGEIESALRLHPGVREAVVVAVPDSKGHKLLAAYVVPDGEFSTDTELATILESHLREALPEYMLPSRYALLDALPLSANGKIDRKSLPEIPGFSPTSPTDRPTSASPLEKTLCHLWAEVLGVETIHPDDSFFSLGGDSLIATRLIGHIRKELAPDLPLDALFTQPRVSELCRHPAFSRYTERMQNTAVPSGLLTFVRHFPEERERPFPLTDVQHTYMIGRTGAYALGGVASHVFFEFDGEALDIERLEDAWKRLVQRHGMLRAVFQADGSQSVPDASPQGAFVVTDLRHTVRPQVEQAMSHLRSCLETQALDVEKGPLWDVRIVRYSGPQGERQRVFFDIDALIADAWSVFLLIDEWFALYDDPQAALPELELTFRDYVLTERELAGSPAKQKDREYWLPRAASLPPAPELPLSGNSGAAAEMRFIRKSGRLDAETWNRMKSRLSESGLTPSGLLIAAYAEVLGTWSKSTHFTLNVTMFNRLPLHEQVNHIVGDFTSLLLLEINGASAPTFIERARTVQSQLWRDMDHRLVNGVEVLREMSRLADGRPVTMPVVFTGAVGLGGSGRDASSLERLGKLVSGMTQTPQIWLDHQTYEQNGALIFNWDAAEGIFPEGVFEAMFEAYEILLQSLASEDAAWSAGPGLPLPAVQSKTRVQVNATDGPVSSAMLHELFARQAAATPGAPALICTGKTLTYRELFFYADHLANILRAKGAGPGTVVAVVMDKCWQQTASVLATLAAGAAYLPLDPSSPPERLKTLLLDSEAVIALTTSPLAASWPASTPHLDAEAALETDIPDRTPNPESWARGQKNDSLAYIIYTSGSTGRPKGVMTGHRGAVNTVLDINQRFGVGPADRVFGLSALTFDLSVYDIFGPLAAGGALVLPDSGHARDPEYWHMLMQNANVSVWNSVPALMQMLTNHLAGTGGTLPSHLRLALLSGDWIPLDLPGEIKKLGSVEIVSLGGATEASIWSIFHPVEGKLPGWSSVPYGRPLTNQTMHVLNEFLEDCPEWTTGQIHIGGIGLARGYWNDREKTDASFIIHPRTGKRLYRTGDMGRYRPNGVIEFIGREDNQVKLGGYRIELGEVEAALSSCPCVRETTAAVTGNRARLTGFVVPEDNPETSEMEQRVKAHASSLLPSYMVPSNVIVLDAMPLSANGKIDRKRLLALAEEKATASRAPAAPPRTEREHSIAAIWRAVLEKEEIDVNEHFFEAGGNSLLAVEVMNRLRPQAPGLSIVALFEHPTIASLAAVLDTGNTPDTAAGPEAMPGSERARKRQEAARNKRKRHESMAGR